MKQITKCHAFEVNVGVENVETLHTHARARVCACVRTCARARALRVRFTVCSGGLVVSIISRVRLSKSGTPVLTERLIPEGNWYRRRLDTKN